MGKLEDRLTFAVLSGRLQAAYSMYPDGRIGKCHVLYGPGVAVCGTSFTPFDTHCLWGYGESATGRYRTWEWCVHCCRLLVKHGYLKVDAGNILVAQWS